MSTLVRLTTPDGNKTDVRKKITAVAGTPSDWFLMPSGVVVTAVEVVPGSGGTAKIQATLDIEAAEADSIDAVDWDAGDVSERTQDTIFTGCAFRLIATTSNAVAFVNGVLS